MVPRSLLDLVPFVLWWFSSASSRIRCSEALDKTKRAPQKKMWTLWTPQGRYKFLISVSHQILGILCKKTKALSNALLHAWNRRHYEARDLHGSSLGACRNSEVKNHGKLSKDMSGLSRNRSYISFHRVALFIQCPSMSIKGQPNLWHQLWQLPHILGPKWQNLWPAERSMEDEKEQIYRISRHCKCVSLCIYIYIYIIGIYGISNWNQPGFLSRTSILTDFIVIHTATFYSLLLSESWTLCMRSLSAEHLAWHGQVEHGW